MSYTYKLKGRRFLRKYTADNTSPVYSAAVDVQTIADTLCEVPWTETNVENASFPNHTNDVIDEETKVTGLDYNVTIRDSFDAALFCAHHTGGSHRAYANAACYKFRVPDAMIGKTMTSLTVRVNTDPYNENGARISIMTNDDGAIPTACATVRTGAAYAEGVIKRTSSTVNKVEYWYPNTGNVTITPEGGIVMGKFLLVFCLLENYNISRGNWIEGSSYIRNQVELSFDDAISDLTEDEVYDASDVDTTSRYTPSKDLEDAYLKLFEGGIKPGVNGVQFDVHTDGNTTTIKTGMTVRRLVMPLSGAGTLTVDYGSTAPADGVNVSVYLADGYLKDETELKDPSFLDNRSDVSGWSLLGHVTESGKTTFYIESSSRFVTVIVAAYLPIEYVNPSSHAHQGTGVASFMPLITIK